MDLKLIVFLQVLLSILCNTDAFKFLLVYPLPVKSLNLLGEGFGRHLLNAGHEVTYITAFPLKKPPVQNFRQIDISKNVEVFTVDPSLNMSHVIEASSEDMGYYQQISYDFAAMTLENENVTKLLKDTNEQFDAVIVDLFETEVYSGLSALYGCPMIWSYSMGAHWLVLRLLDEGSNPAYSAHYMSLNIPPFNFIQRVEELWTRVHWYFLKWFVTVPQEKALYERTFGPLLAERGKVLPPYEDIIYNVSLILSLENYAANNVPSVPQNFKFVGGYHIQSPPNPLPKDLQTLMDNAKHGVIYFSMGTAFKSKDMPIDMRENLLKMFGTLKQIVIWKFEEDLPNVPANVHTVKWAPQHSILVHPNCLFFISHGGLLSSTEALHFGVPIIGIPIFLDQFLNVNKAVARGFAIKVDLNSDIATNLKHAINVMISDNKYRKNVKELSMIYHDRPVPPGVELVHWVEHVVRTRGAPHMRSPALHVPFYQKLYLDLAACLLLVITTLVAIVKRVVCKFSQCSKSSNIRTKEKRN